MINRCGWLPGQRAVAGTTDVAAQNMSRCLARGSGSVMTRCTRAQHLSVINSRDWLPNGDTVA